MNARFDDDTYEDDSAGQADESTRLRGRLRRLLPRRAALITDKRRTPEENLRHREKWYKILQISRVPLFFLFIISFMWWENWIISGILFVLSVPMPWIAVMIANAQGEPRDRRTPQVYKPGLAREIERQQLAAAEQAQLEAARDPDETGGRDTPPGGQDPDLVWENTVDEQVDLENHGEAGDGDVPERPDGPENPTPDQAGETRP